MTSHNRALKEALFENLVGILNSDQNIRQNAEQQIKVFEVTNEYGIHLTEISLDPSVNWPLRQLASVLLKQYIDFHWSRIHDKFQEPEVEAEAKAKIKRLLMHALGNETLFNFSISGEKKLLSSIAYAISAIAHYEWPEHWPDLFQELLNYLSSRNYVAIYGAMKVFSEISHEIVDTQIPSIAPLLLPKMYEIFVDTQNFSSGTRERAVQIFTVIAETIAVMGEYDKVAVKQFLDPILPQFTEALVKILQNQSENELGVQKNALNSLTMLIKNCRKRMWKWMPQILSPVWFSLISSASTYMKTVVNVESEGIEGVGTHLVDSDGEPVCLESLIFSIFDFVSILVENSKSRKLIKQGITDLLYYIFLYMQITDEQIQCWSVNPDQFVEDEDDDSFSYTVRQSALDVLLSLAREYEENESPKENELFQASFIAALKKLFEESNQQRANPKNNWWWKLQESGFFALGSLSESILLTMKQNSSLSMEFRNMLDRLVLTTDQNSPFLFGRSLWTAARFAPIMNEGVLDRFLEATVNSLVDQSPVIKIYGLRSAFNFCVHLKESNQVNLIRSYLPAMLEATISIGNQYSTEVLALSLETVSVLISMDKNFSASVENKVCPLAIATFLRYSSDPVLISITQEIFKELSKNDLCINLLQQRIIPTLLSILNPSQLTPAVQTLQPVAMDILTTIVRNSSVPLSDALINQAFPAVATCILSTADDNATLQNGGECMRAFVSKATDQIAAYRDSENRRDGMSLVLQVCLHILDPRVNETCAAFVGSLIFVTINKASPYIGNDNIHLLLRSVLSKLQTSETLSVVQGLIMVFAHLINHNLPTVLDFLSSLPGPSGSQSALEFVLTQWLNRQHLFYGAYENKVSIMALCKLLEHSIVNSNNQDEKLNLNLIRVPGDPISNDSPGIKTRAKSKPDQWTMIPCSVKILKLLLHELDHIDSESFNDESEEEESENESIDDARVITESSFGPLSSEYENIIDQLTPEEEDDEEDSDVVNDPMFKIDLKQHLNAFIRSFVTTPYVDQFAAHLTELEKNILQKYSQ
ncbi:Importin-9-like protein [Dinothrombium tinctorium]|uniref:Importin-9-like protein n=1 Tax=Dinothrombium tinctorium TaxID=1965070 RepID=A0A3S3SB84_9ACAR|nr:Importin-9-like protein [Dinothrombium tinctorium]RWS13023.1 Importin-9-like protein [Dinothrombium tinctorium]RWS14962.1 Importin-9-like protein [Dinothrombium tinctorium]